MCNVAKIQDSLQHYDIPDRAAVDMLNAFSPPQASNSADSDSGSELDRWEQGECDLCYDHFCTMSAT